MNYKQLVQNLAADFVKIKKFWNMRLEKIYGGRICQTTAITTSLQLFRAELVPLILAWGPWWAQE